MKLNSVNWGFAILLGFIAPAVSSAEPVDGKTLALWLFDEPQSPGITLTDAGLAEIDLRLDTGHHPTGEVFAGKQGLVPGKFGRALKLPVSGGLGVVWPKDRVWDGSAPIPARGHMVPDSMNLGYFDWTMECWFRGDDPQLTRGVLWEVRSEVPPPHIDSPGVNSLVVGEGRKEFLLITTASGRATWNRRISIPTDAARLNDGQWHHIAFVFSRDERQLRHFVDGVLQPLPKEAGFLPVMALVSSLLLGRSQDDPHSVVRASLDELRISSVARYRDRFAPPDTFARHGNDAPTMPTGPRPLFGATAGKVIELGDRKHVFIDGALLTRHENCQFLPQPPQIRAVTDFRCDQAWEATSRFGAGVPDIGSIFDDGGELKMIYTNGGMWGGKPHAVGLAASKDGLTWSKPELHRHAWNNSTKNNIVLPIAAQGMALRDDRPGVPADQRYKYVAWCMNRGIYVFDSPNLIDWRRNETVALPFDPDGTVSIYWDDQAGHFRGLIRALDRTPQEYQRGTVRFEAPILHQPWPFQPSRTPKFHEEGNFENIKPTSGELPRISNIGQTYRHMVVKYAWAPDVFLAFPWRYNAKGNVRPGSFLMTSRDGDRWTVYEEPYYFPSGWKLGERVVKESLSEQGLVRRGEQLWQFCTVRFTEHGGALYGGVENDGTAFDRLLRMTQRLDGFVALVAADNGFAETKPLKFAGNRLELNVSARAGAVRVELAAVDGTPIKGFRLDDCEPIQGDGVAVPVHWKAGRDLGTLASQPIIVRLKLTDAKLFALQFVRSK